MYRWYNINPVANHMNYIKERQTNPRVKIKLCNQINPAKNKMQIFQADGMHNLFTRKIVKEVKNHQSFIRQLAIVNP